MRVRPARRSDIPAVMEIVSQARSDYFEKNGIPQWNNGYPSKDVFEDDLEKKQLYVLSQGENVIGMVVVSFEHENNYDIIEQGEWKTTGEYAVVHRLAVSSGFHGMHLGEALVKLADKLAEQRDVHSIRADTHENNRAMRGTLEKCGFEYCGIIYIDTGALRVAYEKLI